MPFRDYRNAEGDLDLMFPQGNLNLSRFLMNTENLDLFNIGELTPIPGTGGAVRLSRYPSSLEGTYKLPGGKMVSRQSVGCEVRFVPEGDQFICRVSSPEGAKVHFYQGDYWIGTTGEMEPGKLIEFSGAINDRLLKLPDNAEADCLFDSRVIRLFVERGTVYLHDIDTYGFPYRKPTPEELPKKRWLAWGSSITHCDLYGYVFQAASRLDVEVMNKGLSGSCGAEPEIAEWLVNENEWDFATCEWGVNMRHGTPVEEFDSRINASLDIYLKHEKPVFLITSFSSDAHLGLADKDTCERQLAFDDCIRDAYTARKDTHPNLHLIEGKDILKKWNWLVGDLVHPSHQGHSHMGEQLANIIREKI